MLVLQTEEALTPEQKKLLRDEFKKRTGQDCVILDCGLRLEEIRLQKEQPLWKRLLFLLRG